MARVKAGTTTRARHNKLIARAKGYKLGRNHLFRQAKQALLKAGVNAYRDRKVKKRTFRASWIIVLNAGARAHGISYSQLMNGLNKIENTIDRKALATLAKTQPEMFTSIVEQAKKAIA